MKRAVQQRKLDASAALVAQMADVKDLFFTEYHGLSVAQVTELRSQLRKENSSYHVVKNSVAQVAFKKAGKTDDLNKYLKGPTALVFTRGDESGPAAKILATFSKENPALILKGGLVGGEEYDAVKVMSYSKLPTRIELIAQVARTLNEPVAMLARSLQAVVDQKNGN